jgi:hypothetical protein
MRDANFPVHIEIVSNSTSGNVKDLLDGLRIDGALIDGSHYHPWPTVDAMLLLPRMRPGAFIVVHDLHLFMHEDYRDQFGPKFLFDQIPEKLRAEDQERPFPISYAIFVPDEYLALESAMAKSLLLPWSAAEVSAIRTQHHIRSQLAADWGTNIAEIIDRVLARA